MKKSEPVEQANEIVQNFVIRTKERLKVRLPEAASISELLQFIKDVQRDVDYVLVELYYRQGQNNMLHSLKSRRRKK